MKKKEYGYARISRGTQNIERQVRNIQKNYPDAIVFREVFTGTTTNRETWIKLKGKAAEGDTIVFDSVSRMSRNADEGFAEYEELYNRGVNLVFLKEPHINTDVYKASLRSNNIQLTGGNVDIILQAVNRYLMILAKEQIKVAFDQAEKEVADLHQRTREGIETARLNGKQIGRATGKKYVTKKSVEAKKEIRKYSIYFGGTLKDVDMIRRLGIGKNAYYKYKRELLAELMAQELAEMEKEEESV